MSSSSTEYEYCCTAPTDTHECMSTLMSTYALIPAKHALSALRLLRVCSAFAAKLGIIVPLQDFFEGWLKPRLVGAHHDEDAQKVRVHVGVRKQSLR